MKKILFYLMLLCCCPLWLYANPIDAERAKEIASVYVKDSSAPRMVKCALRKNVLATDDQTDSAPFYIFSRGEGQGFVIVSGDDCLPEVLGYTESGDFVESQMPPALLEMLEGYREIVEQAQEQNAPARIQQRALSGKPNIAPMLTTHWNQGWPYNNLAPERADGGGRSLTGCVATAAAQVVYYWRKDLPRVSGYDTPTYGYGEPVTMSLPKGTPLKWELMQNSYGGSTPAEMCDAVATLMYIVGTSTWLTYGSSTSGQISNLVNTFSGQFGLSSTCWYKSGNSQSYWEGLVYDDLAAGRPIVYSGVHPSNGGHAIVLDGYRASDNTFHFNFGWGGQGDGYYTLDDETGVNGFSSQQGMTFRIVPKKMNLAVDIEANQFLQKTDNVIRVKITNNSTLDYSGVYLFCLTGSSGPSDITKATRKDEETIIPRGESRIIEFKFPASVAGTYQLYVTNSNLAILDRISVESVATKADLKLEKMFVESPFEADTLLEVDGTQTVLSMKDVYNNNVYVNSTLFNSEEATYCRPTLKCELFVYDEQTKTFVSHSTRSLANVDYNAGKSSTTSFLFSKLTTGAIYKARMNNLASAGLPSYIDLTTPDSVVYFRVQAPDLVVASQTDVEYVLSGHWNEQVFENLTKDETICRYDLTNVVGVTSIPSVANENALFYVAPNQQINGDNIVQDGVCSNLQLKVGYNFQPREDFYALNASLQHKQDAGKWTMLVLPFDCAVPEGIMARKINELKVSYVYKCDSVNTIMKSGTPYQCIIGSERASKFSASKVMVSVQQPNEGTDSVCGTFVNRIATANNYLLDNSDVQYFVQSTDSVIPAFTGYLNYARKVSSQSYSYKNKDAKTKELAQAIAVAEALAESNKEVVGEQAYNEFISLIDKACVVLTTQPMLSVLVETIKELNTVSETYKSMTPPVVIEGLIDKTELLVNASFERGNILGWTVEKQANEVQFGVTQPSSSLANYMCGGDGDYIFYATPSAGKSLDVYQQLTNLENGIYQVRASFAADNEGEAVLYANDKQLAVVTSAFGPMYFEDYVLDDIVVTDGSLKLGIQGGAKWFKADNFRLYYKGVADGIHVTEKAETQEIRAWGGAGCIMVSVSEPTMLSIYSLDGVLVKRMEARGMITIHNLPKGMYIVNRQKVMVR